MQYNAPFDQPGDPNAPYRDANSRTGNPGSIPPGEAFEYPQRELVNFFVKNKLTPTNDDLDQLSQSFQNQCVIYGIDGGSPNAMVVTLDPVPSSRVLGMTLRIKKSATPNSGAVTLDIGLGADPVVKFTGAAFNANDLPANAILTVIWDGSRWQAKNYLGQQSGVSQTVNNYVTEIPYCEDTSVTPNTITAPFNPAITSLNAGKLLLVKLNRAFTGGAVNIAVNDMSSLAVKRGDGVDPLLGDGAIGQILLLEFDGAVFQIVNSSTPSRPLLVMLVDQKAQGVSGGTFTSGAWRTRDLNTVRADPFGLITSGYVALSNNRFTLAAGKWIIHARSPACGNTWFHQHRVWNITDNAEVLRSTLYNGTPSGGGTRVEYDFVDGMVTLAAPKTFEVQGACGDTFANYGFGTAGGSNDPGPETYTVVHLIKVS